MPSTVSHLIPRCAPAGSSESTIERVEADADRAYGRVFSAVINAGRKPHEARAVDLLKATTAVAASLPLYTRNPDDFESLDDLIEAIAV